ncbi:MAG: response regulator [Vicinamibacterales bacterium]
MTSHDSSRSPAARAPALRGAPREADLQRGPLHGRLVLLVEPDQAAATTLAAALAAEGAEVALAGNAEDALAHLDDMGHGARLPEAVVTNLVLPRMNGLLLVARLRACLPAHVPVVALTDLADPAVVALATEGGCDAALPTSEDPHGLITVLAGQLGARRAPVR